MVSSATLAAFSKPVIAKKASETPASTARIDDPAPPSALNCRSTEGSVTRSTRAMMPMITTMTRPLISMKVITTFTMTDSEMPIRLMAVMMATKMIAMRAAAQIASAGSPMRPPKYRTNPEASDPTAAMLAESMQMVMKNVSTGLRKALLM